jgi:hypothetical protein
MSPERVWYLIQTDQGATFDYSIIKYEGVAEVGAELFGGIVIMRYEPAEALLISDMVDKKTIDAAERLLKASAESIVENSVYAAGVKAINKAASK